MTTTDWIIIGSAAFIGIAISDAGHRISNAIRGLSLTLHNDIAEGENASTHLRSIRSSLFDIAEWFHRKRKPRRRVNDDWLDKLSETIAKNNPPEGRK